MDICEQHQQLFSDIQVIKEKVTNVDRRVNGSIDAIEKHIKDGKTWRAIVASTALAIILNVVAFSYMYGKLCQKTDTVVYAIEELKELHPRK
jgi:hypothetical protein